MANGDLSKTFKNTFQPNCLNKEFTVGQIIRGLKMTLFDYDRLPREIQTAVMAELRSQKKTIAA